MRQVRFRDLRHTSGTRIAGASSVRPRGFEPPRTIRSTRPSTLASQARWVANPLCSTIYVLSVAATFAQFGARIGAREQSRSSPRTRQRRDHRPSARRAARRCGPSAQQLSHGGRDSHRRGLLQTGNSQAQPTPPPAVVPAVAGSLPSLTLRKGQPRGRAVRTGRGSFAVNDGWSDRAVGGKTDHPGGSGARACKPSPARGCGLPQRPADGEPDGYTSAAFSASPARA